MERQLAKEDAYDAVPDSIPPPDILGDFAVWNETHWDYWAIRNQPSTWLTKIQMAHAESSRVQAELYDDRYRVEDKRKEREEIGPEEIAEIRASDPKLASLPEAALKKLYSKRRRPS